jgi:transcription initiation factor TFIIIB Brf1 subunit/transcription initiation factor TFIIB
MDPNMLNQLGLDAGNTELLQQLISKMANGNKKNIKMTATERNNLLSQVANQNTKEYVPEKEFKDMNDEEKKIHRDILKNRLRGKQNSMKQLRNPKSSGQKKSVDDALSNINGLMQNLDLNQIQNHAAQVAENAVNADNTDNQENINDYLA